MTLPMAQLMGYGSYGELWPVGGYYPSYSLVLNPSANQTPAFAVPG